MLYLSCHSRRDEGKSIGSLSLCNINLHHGHRLLSRRLLLFICMRISTSRLDFIFQLQCAVRNNLEQYCIKFTVEITRMDAGKTVVHWFRKGLRLHDNPSLIAAIDALKVKDSLRPIFILDPEIIKWLRVGPNRWRFLQQSLENLDSNLRRINSRQVK